MDLNIKRREEGILCLHERRRRRESFFWTFERTVKRVKRGKRKREEKNEKNKLEKKRKNVKFKIEKGECF